MLLINTKYMINILGFVIARESEITKLDEQSYKSGYEIGYDDAVYKQSKIRISPITGKPVRKYTKRK